jgi:phospholipase A1
MIRNNHHTNHVGLITGILVALALLPGVLIDTANAEVPLGDSPSNGGLIDSRLRKAADTAGRDWVISPYRPNYIMPLTYSFDPNNEPLRELGNEDGEFDNIEVKFQFSFILPLFEDVLWDNGDINFGYTQISFWNSYNTDLSEAFRDTNYEPELFALFDTGFDILGMRNEAVSVGFVHQSNGRGTDVLSRSWNRIYVSTVLERGNFVMSMKPWWRIPEKDKHEENPNIERYLGYGEVKMFYKHKDQVLSAMVRNNLKSDENKGAIELGWSFPLHRQLKGYVQYFDGYGESLVDYDYRNQRISVGVMLSDWL